MSGLASPELVRLLDGFCVELLVVGEMIEMRLLGVLAGVELVINWPPSSGNSMLGLTRRKPWEHGRSQLHAPR